MDYHALSRLIFNQRLAKQGFLFKRRYSKIERQKDLITRKDNLFCIFEFDLTQLKEKEYFTKTEHMFYNNYMGISISDFCFGQIHRTRLKYMMSQILIWQGGIVA
ncbi:MAG: hypothetical protein IJJ13_00660 [Lachnospiraceae bacterium]|nr:hypothetical protein [Lachnospiraceae bacterium]